MTQKITPPDDGTGADNDPKPTVPRLLPPHLFLVSVILILTLDYLETGQFGVNYMGLVLTVLAVLMAARARACFTAANTTIFPGAQPTALVTEGPFRYSRNPMYTAMVAALVGLWPLTGGYSPMAVIVAFAAIIQNRFILMEEQHMLRTFGEDYLRYCMQVRRWI